MYIKKYNEGFFWKNSINDLYIRRFIRWTKRVKPPNDNQYVLGVEISDLSLYKDYEANRGARYGVFINNSSKFSNIYYFSSDYSGGTEVWLDVSHYYERLYKTSEKLGLVNGVEVIVNNTRGIIDGMDLLAFYKGHQDIFLLPDINIILTMAYNVNGKWYQPSEITLVKDIKKNEIIGEEIEDNFLDMIESGELQFSVQEVFINNKQVWKVSLRSDLSSPQNLDKVTSQLLVMTNRLNYKNISTEITDINLDKIEFTCSSF